MSDLISRSALIDMLLTENQRCITSTSHELTINMVVSFIKAQPTAYDIDKVIEIMDEALIEFEDGTNCETCVFKDTCDDEYDGCVQTMVSVCKGIVRKGGME